MSSCPIGRGHHAPCQQRDVKPIFGRADVDPFFRACQEIEEKRREPSFVQRFRNLAIPGAEAAAAASVREDHEPACRFGKMEIAVEHVGAVGNAHRVDDHSTLHVTLLSDRSRVRSELSRDHRSSGVNAVVVSM